MFSHGADSVHDAGGSVGVSTGGSLVPARFVWPYGGKRVFLTGSFTRWTEHLPMSPVEGCPTVFQAICSLSPGIYQYKFFVDGEWRHDERRPTITGDYGVVNTLYVTREVDQINTVLSPSTPGSRMNMDVDNETFQRTVSLADGTLLEGPPRISEAAIQISRCRVSEYLNGHTGYDLLPDSGKVIALDINLPVKQSFHILHEQGIPVAPLWDSFRGQFVGLLSPMDFILILRELETHGSNLTEEQLETHTISAWKEAKRQTYGRNNGHWRSNQHLVHATPYESLRDIATKILQTGVSTVPIIFSPSSDGSFPQLLHLASLSGILKCICRYFKNSTGNLPILNQPVCTIPLGTWVPKIGDPNGHLLAMLRPNASLSSALDLLVQAGVSSIPIVDDNDSLLDTYSRSDITALAKDKVYTHIRLDDMTIHQALCEAPTPRSNHRNPTPRLGFPHDPALRRPPSPTLCGGFGARGGRRSGGLACFGWWVAAPGLRSEMADGCSDEGNASAHKGSARRRGPVQAGLDADELLTLMHGSDPVKVELNRLENEVRDKDRELGEAQAEIKALRLSERAREKAVEELTAELEKLDEKLKLTESLLQSKNLELKKTNDEKKAAMAAQFAAEATLRRVHAAQKDDDMPPIEAILAPLEAELKIARQEIAKLQDDNRALDRLTKQKEAALLEAERTVQIALAKAAMVDDMQNKNQELMKQIEICQEENKILDRLHRQKVAEVEKLSQTVRELEEAVLAGGAAANAVRDYKRKVQEMNEERKVLDRELARAKVTANRVAVVVANEWKDANDKVMPVKQWLEDRRFLQGEMQQLRDKLAIAERTARSEAHLKEKYQTRLKVLEDGLRGPPSGSSRPPTEGKGTSNGPSRRLSLGGADNMAKVSPNGLLVRRSPSFNSRSSLSTSSSLVLKHAKGTSRSFDGGTRSLDRGKVLSNGPHLFNRSTDAVRDCETTDNWKASAEEKSNETTNSDSSDTVSGVLYDMLQKEVVSLRKACHEKDQSLKDKDDAIEMLAKKVDTLTKAMEVEAKKMRREVAAMEKEVAAMCLEKEQENKAKRLGNLKGPGTASQALPGRNAPRGGLTRNLQ